MPIHGGGAGGDHRFSPASAGERYAGLAIGVPLDGSEHPELDDVGAVNVLYGSSAGLTAAEDQLWHQDANDVEDWAEGGDRFGGALTAGDFDGDGYVDLAVGVPHEDLGSPEVENAGAVAVLYGSVAGLSPVGDQLWYQDGPGIEGAGEAGDGFGLALAAGDFDGDGYIDLAVGVPFDNVEGLGDAGALNVLYGSSQGLTAVGNQWWHQNSPEAVGVAEWGDWFGYSLAAGDLNGDGYADLAIGVPHEDVGNPEVTDAGAVNVLYGSSDGLSAMGDQMWYQDSPDVEGTPREFDEFGFALATGDFDGDGYLDLAVGVPGDSAGGLPMPGGGAVNILMGSSVGLTVPGNRMWHQDSPGVGGVAQLGDRFGSALTAGDLDGDGCADLAVGVPYEDVGNPEVADAGVVNVLYGSRAGLTATGDQLWYQDSAGVIGVAQQMDYFGSALASGDLDGDGHADLAVGVPGEDVASPAITNAGAVNVLYGSSSGLSADKDQMWHQDSPGIEGTAEEADGFGATLIVVGPVRRRVYLPLIQRQSPSDGRGSTAQERPGRVS
jgi:hypothetical protein